jgi:bacillithiol biosynthesis deacetylase BshB1
MSSTNDSLIYGHLDEVDILAIGPHPDDIEIGTAGSLILWRLQGYRIGLVDLTQGELGTKGTSEIRLAESIDAAQRLEALFRVNLRLEDGAIEDNAASRESLVAIIRKARPQVVLCNYEEARHPDHAAGSRLAQAAFFLSRLTKYLPLVPAHSPIQLFYYLIHEQASPTFLVDVSPCFDAKFHVLAAYESQFASPHLPAGYRYTGLSDYPTHMRHLGHAWGAQAGISAAEAFVVARPLVVSDIATLLGNQKRV